MSQDNTYILNRFRIKVIAFIAIITGILLLETYLIITGQSYFTISIVTVILSYFIYKLFSLVNKTNRDLSNFLMSIRYDDFETTYSQGQDQSEDKASLYKAFNLITGKFRDIRSEKEAQHQFLIAIVEQVETGIICFDQNGETILMNHALQKLLHKSYVPTIESLKKINLDLYESIINYQLGERKLLNVKIENDMLQLAYVGTAIVMNGETLRLFSFQNIRSELDYREMESWQKLIRILTHEIMNSVSPVVSLASTTDHIISKAQGLDHATRSDLHQAINAIQKRGESLLDFTDKYRQLTRVPPPEFEKFDLKELLDRLIILHKAEIEEKSIQLIKNFPEHKVILNNDPGLLDQAFINLIKNAIEALEGHQNPTLNIQIYKEAENVIVQIADTGDGIEEGMMDQIFVPFFTTKQAGSGIGLSLCRQIIVACRGSIDVQSEFGKGTVFTIKL